MDYNHNYYYGQVPLDHDACSFREKTTVIFENSLTVQPVKMPQIPFAFSIGYAYGIPVKISNPRFVYHTNERQVAAFKSRPHPAMRRVTLAISLVYKF